MAREEIAARQADIDRLERELQTALLPRDPDDERNAFLEIRAGTGGDESALFAGDLPRMYLRYCERQGWRTEVMSRERRRTRRLQGTGAARSKAMASTRSCKFESGGHRVQRVPATETQGRIHTSACTVAVMPEPDEAEESQLNPADLRIDTFRASGAGGQHVNKTDCAIRITHLPTGIVAECQDDRSQHRNKAKAMAVLAARLRDKDRSERAAKEAATRKGLIGSGDRSDRIRTYNFPQGRLTDHRINLTLYKLQADHGRRPRRRDRRAAGGAARPSSWPQLESGAAREHAVATPRWRWPRAAAASTRLDAQLLLAHLLSATAHLAARARRRSVDARAGGALVDALARRAPRRAAGLPRRREGVSRPGAAGVARRADAAPRNRTAGRLGARTAALTARRAATRGRPGHRQRRHRPGAEARAARAAQSRRPTPARRAGRGPRATPPPRASTSSFMHGDWWQRHWPGAASTWSLCNPPYIAGDDPHLAALRHEPRRR